MSRHVITALLFSFGVAAGCGDGEERAPSDTAVPPLSGSEAPAPGSAGGTATAADTTGEALWARLQREQYQSWSLWPGKEKLYTGQEPHGALLTTYINGLAQDGITNGAARMAPGSIIVKENYGPDRKLMAITVMQKVQGFDPQHQDWFWAKYQPDGAVEVSGRVGMCQECHAGAADHDGLWTLKIAKTGEKPPPTKM